MQKIILIISSLLGALSVAIGAFGAHGLADILEKTGRVATFETAVKYQFYHTLALFLVGILMSKMQHNLLNYAAFSFIGGIIIFSGSLYILSITDISKWGAVTPFGGLLFIFGWILLFISFLKL